jgi:hypothetical protein
MGLDITAYSELSYAQPQPNEDDAGDFVNLYSTHYQRLLSQQEGYYTRNGERVNIACGSYGRYSHWRESLARLAGWPLGEYEQYGAMHPSHCASAWKAQSGPFWELINFSDCDGSIGFEVSSKLAQDFQQYRPSMAQRATLMQDEGYFMKKYDEWAAAFALAAQNGAVKFH